MKSKMAGAGLAAAAFTFLAFSGVKVAGPPGTSDAVAGGVPCSEFATPREVAIQRLPGGAWGIPISTEEPFVSRDGRFLFFNSGKQENHKDLHYAERVGGRWVYRGEIGPDVNDPKEVQGNPTMDREGHFFYVDSGTGRMIRRAIFLPDRGELRSIRELDAVPKRRVRLFAQRITGNMGVEVSADGGIVFFSRATWALRGVALGRILESDILFVERKQGGYGYDEAKAARIMGRINTADLEYAASISSDGLELFFTRLALRDLESGRIRSRIMRSTRRSLLDPFGEPREIGAIGGAGFVEGPAIADNGRTLYYHKRIGPKFRLFKVSRPCRLRGRDGAARGAQR